MKFNSSKGFTLIEILLVTGLFAIMVIGVNGSVKFVRRGKEIVDSKNEAAQAFRATFGIMERDLRAAYMVTAEDFLWNPRKIHENNDESAPLLPTPSKPTPITIFQGKETTLFFNTRTHQRLSANAAENEENFVVYDLKDGQLIRSESRHAIRIEDREKSEDFRAFILVDKVTSVKFSFWDKKQAKYVPDWDSEKTDHLNKVPEAVKIELKFTPNFDLETGKKEAKELVLVTSIRLAEAEFRNIDWSSATSSSGASSSSGVVP